MTNFVYSVATNMFGTNVLVSYGKGGIPASWTPDIILAAASILIVTVIIVAVVFLKKKKSNLN
jgi:hypothetical protein